MLAIQSNKLTDDTLLKMKFGLPRKLLRQEFSKPVIWRLIEKVKAESKAEVICNLITKLGLPDAQAAEVAEVPGCFRKRSTRFAEKEKIGKVSFINYPLLKTQSPILIQVKFISL
ncbi:MAG: hypothetical protein QM668_04435 [Agriterribacter sp.]